MARRKTERQTLHCSFCDKSQHEVRKLIAGPTVFICDECTELCRQTIDREPEDLERSDLIRYVFQIEFESEFTNQEKKLIPAIVTTIEAQYPEQKISIRNLRSIKGGVTLDLNFDSPVKLNESELKKLQEEVRLLALKLKIAQEKYLAAISGKEKFEKLYTDLVQEVMPLMIAQLKKQGVLSDRILKTLLVFFADIVGFSQMNNEDRQQKLDLLRLIGRAILKSENGMYVNTWGDGVVAGFEDPTQGLRCACKFVAHLNVDGLDARIGVNWGIARIAYNDITDRLDIDGESINIGARLEPLADPGEVLASDIVVSLDELDKKDFVISKKAVVLKKNVGKLKSGETLNAYSVRLYPNT